jgi:hypothetical protein
MNKEEGFFEALRFGDFIVQITLSSLEIPLGSSCPEIRIKVHNIKRKEREINIQVFLDSMKEDVSQYLSRTINLQSNEAQEFTFNDLPFLNKSSDAVTISLIRRVSRWERLWYYLVIDPIKMCFGYYLGGLFEAKKERILHLNFNRV